MTEFGHTVFITFGSDHVHTIGGVTFGYGINAAIRCDNHEQGRKLAFAYFGAQFAFCYDDEPRGVTYYL